MNRFRRVLCVFAVTALLLSLFLPQTALAATDGTTPVSAPAAISPLPATDVMRLADLSGDGVPELLIGLPPADDLRLNTLTVYVLKNGQYAAAGTLAYRALTLADLTGDGQAELLTLTEAPRGDMDPPASLLTVHVVANGLLQQVDQVRLDGWPLAVSTGLAADDQLGIFVELGVGAHSATTELLFFDHGRLSFGFADAFTTTFKAYPLYSLDVNGDGIVEIGLQVEPPAANYALYEMPWILTWRQWDGRRGLGPVVAESYSDWGLGVDFAIPAAWQGKYTIVRDNNGDLPGVRFVHAVSAQASGQTLLTFRQYRSDEWATEARVCERLGMTYSIVAVKDGVVTVAIFPSAATGAENNEYRGLVLDAADLAARLTPLSK